MIDDYKSLENLSETFHRTVVSNQKKLNELRASQFQFMESDKPKVNFRKLVEKHKEFTNNEKAQIAILTKEMNDRLLEKFKDFKEDDSFKNKELEQERILLEELSKKQTKQIMDASGLLSAESEISLMPLLVHVDMLLQKQELTEKQKNHLKNIKQNILSSLDVF